MAGAEPGFGADGGVSIEPHLAFFRDFIPDAVNIGLRMGIGECGIIGHFGGQPLQASKFFRFQRFVDRTNTVRPFRVPGRRQMFYKNIICIKLSCHGALRLRMLGDR